VAETLLSASGVLLYGREVEDLQLTYRDPTTDLPDPETDEPPPRLGGNRFLQRQLGAHANDEKRKPRIARIYGFSFEGHYYDLPRPALFLVHGEGTLVEGPLPSEELPDRRYSRAPARADRSGVGATDQSFSDDIRVWVYDKGDFSIRLDVSTGSFEQILLEVQLSTDSLKSFYGGQRVRSRGPRDMGED
jgi:hypothetical protein